MSEDIYHASSQDNLQVYRCPGCGAYDTDKGIALAAEVARLRGALEVYAKAEHWHSLETDDNMAWEAWNKFEHGYDTARAALAPHECAGDDCDRCGGE